MDERTVEEIRSRIDLADLIASYGVQLRRTGSGVVACCPFHHEKTPSFHINSAKGYYHCFGCGESGDAFSFVQKQEGLTFPEALKKLADQAGVKYEEGRPDPQAGRRKRLMALMTELAAFYHRCLGKIAEARLAREYLAQRALDGRATDEWQLGYAPEGCATILRWGEKYGYTPEEIEAAGVIKAPTSETDRGYHRFGGRLMFPIRDKQGRTVAFSGRQLVERKNSGKYVNSPETDIFRKSDVLFGFDKAAAKIANAPHREVIVCEGQIDCIRLHLSGFPVAVASQGTAFTWNHLRMLKRVADAAVLVFDDDPAGHKATIRSAGMLLAAELPVRTVRLPGGDDPDSFLRSHPPEDFQRLVDAAESIIAFQCRVERAKERDPGSIDAVARVTRALLTTIVQCPNAILKAQMVGEAARLLSLPVAALNDELSRMKAPDPAAAAAAAQRAEAIESAAGSAEASAAMDGAGGESSAPAPAAAAAASPSAPPLAVADAGAVAPPPLTEMAFLEFLFANERSRELDEKIGEFLPESVFAHEFTRRFVLCWRMECADPSAGGDEDALTAFVASLDPLDRRWFDKVLLGAGRIEANTERPIDVMKDFIRMLWVAHLRRRRGALPANGDENALAERLKLTADIRRLDLIKWSDVKQVIKEYLHGQQRAGSENQE